ncbi:hypothetical protein AN963_18300 [Brevibacillus choshinensis]|uniref:Uncharacterized protein n=1 Tax=Brevibacillus choshinensis TaxID=54911 RepID=A0ABR5N8R7_BRECH|nr:hypothetical protein AN963_18300 [Brevibacillus choshinensis]
MNLLSKSYFSRSMYIQNIAEPKRIRQELILFDIESKCASDSFYHLTRQNRCSGVFDHLRSMSIQEKGNCIRAVPFAVFTLWSDCEYMFLGFQHDCVKLLPFFKMGKVPFSSLISGVHDGKMNRSRTRARILSNNTGRLFGERPS